MFILLLLFLFFLFIAAGGIVWRRQSEDVTSGTLW
jgi:hypothetical protein